MPEFFFLVYAFISFSYGFALVPKLTARFFSVHAFAFSSKNFCVSVHRISLIYPPVYRFVWRHFHSARGIRYLFRRPRCSQFFVYVFERSFIPKHTPVQFLVYVFERSFIPKRTPETIRLTQVALLLRRMRIRCRLTVHIRLVPHYLSGYSAYVTSEQLCYFS